MAVIVDIRSVVFSLMLVGAIEWAVMLIIWLSRKTYPGFGCWMAGTGLFCVALFLLPLRGTLPDLYSVWLANVLLMGASVLYFEGTLRFREQPGRRVLSASLVVLMALAIFVFRFVVDLIEVRIVIASLLLATVNGLVTWALLNNRPAASRATFGLQGYCFAVMSAFMVIRALSTAAGSGPQDFFSPHYLQSLVFLIPLLLSIPWTFGFVIMNSERLEAGLSKEIVERTSAEEALKKSEEEHRLLIERLPLAVCVDVQGRITYVNPAFMALFKVPSCETIIGRRMSDFAAPELFDTIEERRRLMNEDPRQLPPLEIHLRCLDGTFITVVSTSIATVFQEQPAILTALYDITERKQGEIELQKARKLLELQAREIEDLRGRRP